MLHAKKGWCETGWDGPPCNEGRARSTHATADIASASMVRWAILSECNDEPFGGGAGGVYGCQWSEYM